MIRKKKKIIINKKLFFNIILENIRPNNFITDIFGDCAPPTKKNLIYYKNLNFI